MRAWSMNSKDPWSLCVLKFLCNVGELVLRFSGEHTIINTHNENYWPSIEHTLIHFLLFKAESSVYLLKNKISNWSSLFLATKIHQQLQNIWLDVTMFGLNTSRKFYAHIHFNGSMGVMLQCPFEENCKDDNCKPCYCWSIGFKAVDAMCLLASWMFNLAFYFVISLVAKLCLWHMAHTDATNPLFLGTSECWMSSQWLLSMCTDFFHNCLYNAKGIHLFESLMKIHDMLVISA